MYACTFTEGKARMGWKIKVLVRGIDLTFWSEVLVQGFGLRFLVRGIGPRIWSEVLIKDLSI